jgi:hypothetical protein
MVGWWWRAVRDFLDWGVVEAGKRTVDVNEKSVPCQETNGDGKFGSLHLEHVLGLEENFIDLSVFVNYALLFSW